MKTPSSLVGCAVGDALGVPWEMKSFEDLGLMKWDGDYKDSPHHRTRGGQWSDDTQLSTALASSIIVHHEFIPEQAAESYLKMYLAGNDARWIAGSGGMGGIRGIGRATRTALRGLAEGLPWWRSGTLEAEGNGTAMRAAPIGVRYRKDLTSLKEAAFLDAVITHKSQVAKEASYVVALIAALLSEGAAPLEAIGKACASIKAGKVLHSLVLGEVLAKKGITDFVWRLKKQQEIGVDGHAAMTVGRCAFVLGSTTSYEEAVTLAVRGGGDADSAAAIVGAWAGLYYGLPPEKYLKELEEYERLKGYDSRLWEEGG